MSEAMVQDWREIPGTFGAYEVAGTGAVRSVARDIIRSDGKPLHIESKLMKATVSNAGYMRVNLKVGGKSKQMSVHRAVAMAFIPNPENKREVNHRNGDKLDNRVSNLEWATPKENTAHKYATGLARHCDMSAVSERNRKPVTVDGRIEFESVKDAAKFIGCQPSSVSSVLRGRYKTTHGHTVAYKEEDGD